MTNSPGDWQPPQDPNQQPGYWEQQQQPYGQQPYGQPYGQQPGYPAAYAPDHPKATTSLVLGILGIVVCGLVAPFAWRIGKKTRDEIDASNGQLGGRGAAQAGYVLGLIGTILLALGLVLVVLLVVGSLVTATTSTVSTSSY
jgi:hypothetical protein